MIDPTTPIAVTLQVQQWSAVMEVLANGSYRVVAPLIQSIHQQCQAAAESPPSFVPGRGNGMLDGEEGADP